jgi:RNA recognition motif-containing protein
LYIKNIDKRVDRKDLIEVLLPFFDNNQEQLDKEVEVIIMKKGRMRGQGFMNFVDI